MLDCKNIEEALDTAGEVAACTWGLSMYPMLRNKKDTVIIEKLHRKLKRYDVPLYRLSSGKLVLHRIIKLTPDGYIIRGDNLYKNEYNVTDDNIIGVLKAFKRGDRLYDCATSKLYKIYIFYIRVS